MIECIVFLRTVQRYLSADVGECLGTTDVSADRGNPYLKNIQKVIFVQ